MNLKGLGVALINPFDKTFKIFVKIIIDYYLCQLLTSHSIKLKKS